MAQPENYSQGMMSSKSELGAGDVEVSNVNQEEAAASKNLQNGKEIKATNRVHPGTNVNDGVSFLLEEPRSDLKKGFNFEVKGFWDSNGELFIRLCALIVEKVQSAHTVSPLQTQIAGHGSENDGQR